MNRMRKIFVAALFAGFVWSTVRGLGELGRSGWAGNVIRHNLSEGTDATALFYTELEAGNRRHGKR